jgi:hypothetical protein
MSRARARKPGCLISRIEDTATPIVRRRFMNIIHPTWPGLLWGMALLGLLLLPADYRAGAEIAHPHSLVQTWADAADGTIHHHQIGVSHEHHNIINWLDPELEDPRGVADFATSADPDFAEQHDSVPASSGVHLLIDAVIVLLITAACRAPLTTLGRLLIGRTPRMLHPPPQLRAIAT